MNTFLLLGFLAGASPDADAAAALALARAARERVVAPAVVKAEPVRTGYPVRGNWWTGCPNWTHLTTGVHAGSFPVEWLKTLTNAEVQSLHSDQHENKVRWEYVPKSPTRTVVPPVVRAPAYCPPGASH